MHTPEFEFEKNVSNVEDAVKRFGILYPVAMDNSYGTWQNYNNQYWPAHYLIDQTGILRKFHFGEGGYLETENAIRSLLGQSPLDMEEQLAAARPITPETYLGEARGFSYAPGIDLKPGQTADYAYSGPLGDDLVGIRGKWIAGKEQITSAGDNSFLELNFLATRVYLVMSSEAPAEVSVLLDGGPLPKKYMTDDMSPEGKIKVGKPRKYDVINLKGEYARHIVTLIVPKGVSLYAFTFGDEK